MISRQKTHTKKFKTEHWTLCFESLRFFSKLLISFPRFLPCFMQVSISWFFSDIVVSACCRTFFKSKIEYNKKSESLYYETDFCGRWAFDVTVIGNHARPGKSTLLHENFVVSRSSSENREMKMPRKMHFELNREIKMPRKKF